MTENIINALAISGEAGTGKTTIANRIGEIMGWKVVGAGSRFRAHRSPDANIGASTGTDTEHDAIDEAMAQAMRRGRAIAEGRVAGVMAYTHNLRNAKRILLTCPSEKRYQRIWERDNKLYKSLDEVRTITSAREADNLRVFTERLGYSYLDPSLYHLTVNTGNYSVEQTLEMVMGAINVAQGWS